VDLNAKAVELDLVLPIVARQRGGTLQPQRVSVGRRFPLLCEVLRELPVGSAIIDGELVASNRRHARLPASVPSSAKPAQLRAWAFDLLALNRKDLRRWSLEAGQGGLQALVSRFDCPVLLRSSTSEACSSSSSNPAILRAPRQCLLASHYILGVAVELVQFIEELTSKQYKTTVGVRFENSGYSLVEPMDRVQELF